MNTRLGGPDDVSIRLVKGWPHGLVYDPAIPPSHKQTADLIQEHFTDGSSVFRDGDNVAQYYFVRVKNYAHIETLAAARIRWAESSGECHPYRFIQVADALSWVKWFKTLTPKEYVRRVYGRDYGFPPFSILCRCWMAGLIDGVDDHKIRCLAASSRQRFRRLS